MRKKLGRPAWDRQTSRSQFDSCEFWAQRKTGKMKTKSGLGIELLQALHEERKDEERENAAAGYENGRQRTRE
jgi:hypothetical protein